MPDPDSKLVFLIRHGQAVSNYLADFLGPDLWYKYEEKCSYSDDNSTYWGIFDAGRCMQHLHGDGHDGLTVHEP